MDNQGESSSWATKDFTIPLLLSGVFTAVVCVALCVVLYLSRDFISHDLAPRLGFVEPTPTPALCPPIPAGWRTLMDNNFDRNKYAWPIGTNTDAYADTNLRVENGVLRYNIKAHQGVYYPQIPGINRTPENFYVTTQVRKIDGPLDAQYGLTFRISGDQFLYFSVRDSGEIVVYPQNAEGNWLPPLFSGYSEHINIGEENKLAVLGQGDHYTLCINQYVEGEIDTTDYPSGEFGIAVDLNDAGDEATFEFDDFIIYAP